ncbi:cyclin-dependent kinase inhibitor 2A-like [Liolophura sinensis]|uniref:cyclin-dependent kinase inhibitor 2A-like n=1 Tax=Liolophura sinensis TaxID=3198878 RepID=UPI0031581519
MAATMDVATAAASGDIFVMKALLERNADVNRISSDGMSPLAVASFWGYADIVQVLLENGANVNICNKGTLWTALHCAAFQGHGKVLMKLMEYRPDVKTKDSQGRTAVDFASALDSIWPIFAAAGCTRTSKAELIRLDIVKKVTTDPCAGMPAASRSDVAHFSRPGSAYVFKTPQFRGLEKWDQNMEIASATGDVLAGTTDDFHNSRTRHPHLSIWNR